MTTIRALKLGEESLVEHCLLAEPASTMILRSNLARVGLHNEGRPFEGTYFGAFENDELRSVAAHYSSGALIFSPGAHATALAEAALAHGSPPLRALLGPAAVVAERRTEIGRSLLNLAPPRRFGPKN